MNTRLDITQLYDLFFKGYPDVLSAKDAMEILQISDKTLYKLLHSGQLKSIRIRNSFRIPKLFLEKKTELSTTGKVEESSVLL